MFVLDEWGRQLQVPRACSAIISAISGDSSILARLPKKVGQQPSFVVVRDLAEISITNLLLIQLAKLIGENATIPFGICFSIVA